MFDKTLKLVLPFMFTIFAVYPSSHWPKKKSIRKWFTMFILRIFNDWIRHMGRCHKRLPIVIWRTRRKPINKVHRCHRRIWALKWRICRASRCNRRRSPFRQIKRSNSHKRHCNNNNNNTSRSSNPILCISHKTIIKIGKRLAPLFFHLLLFNKYLLFLMTNPKRLIVSREK